MKVGIVGSRGFTDRDRVRSYVDTLVPSVVVVSGACRGPDSWAAERARERGMAVVEYPADWDKHGRAAGFIRNGLIVGASDVLVAFWDGTSKGTADSIAKARATGKPVTIIQPAVALTPGDELRELLAKATPGPWERLTVEGLKDHVGRPRLDETDDAALIVAAINALPALLDVVDTLADIVGRFENLPDIGPQCPLPQGGTTDLPWSIDDSASRDSSTGLRPIKVMLNDDWWGAVHSALGLTLFKGHRALAALNGEEA